MNVGGTGINGGTTILSINTGASSIVLSQPAVGSGTNPLNFNSTIASINSATQITIGPSAFATASGVSLGIGGGQVELDRGEFINPFASSPAWATFPTIPGTLDTSGTFGDQETELLNNGTLLATDPGSSNSFAWTIPTNPANDASATWTATAGNHLNGNDNEDNWVMLPNGDVLDYEINASDANTNALAELYVPNGGTIPANDGGGVSSGQWVNASTGLIQLTAGGANGPTDMGPGVLLPFYAPFNGPAAFYIGWNGSTAYYNPATNGWAAGPAEPTYMGQQMSTADGPAAVLPDGEVLMALSPQTIPPVTSQNAYYGTPTRIYLFNPNAANPATAFVDVTPPDGTLGGTNSYQESMLELPTGQILMSDSSSTLWIYTPTGSAATPASGTTPTITSITTDPSTGLLQINGTLLNGADEGAYYGDDEQMSSNYPIVQLTTNSGSIAYATTSNWQPGVVGGGTQTDFAFPAGTNASNYTSLVVIANGIASAPAQLGAITLSPSGQLTVNANFDPSGAHMISIEPTAGGGVQVSLDGQTMSYGPGQVTSIDIVGGPTSNTIDLEGVPSGVTSITVQGTGTTTLEAPSGVSDVWHNTGVGSGTLDIGMQTGIVTFTGVTNEMGGGTDTFKFEGGSVPGYVDGNGGVASLDYSALLGVVNVNLLTDTATDIGTTFSNISNFIGDANPADTITGPGGMWTISGTNAGSVAGFAFSSFANVVAASGPDDFVYQPGGSLSGNLEAGAGGTSTLDYSARTDRVNVNLQTDVASDIGGMFSDISNFIGGTNSYNTVFGPDAMWTISGPNAESLDGDTFSSFGNLVGGTGPDQFVFQPGGSVSGNINGGGGTDTLDYSSLATRVTVNLETDTASEIGGTFTAISKFIGSSGNNTLVMRPQATCDIAGSNSETIYSQSFTSFENLVGASYDQFLFHPGGGLSGNLTGMGGNNVVSYANIPTAVSVNLGESTAPKIGGTFAGISRFIGGTGVNTVIGAERRDLVEHLGRQYDQRPGCDFQRFSEYYWWVRQRLICHRRRG